MDNHYLLSADEAARILGVTRQTISKAVRSGALPAQKVSNRWVFDRCDLSSYLAEHNLIPEPCDHPIIKVQPGIAALSFFSGALGLDLGFEQAGIHASLFCENDRKCRMTIQSMRPEPALIGDISQYGAKKILEMAGIGDGHVDVMFGGPPCQAFSTAGARRAFDDARGNVFLKYIELVKEIKPTYVVIENVRGLLSTAYPLEERGEPVKGGALRIILNKLELAGYSVSFNLYNSANYGAAQIRERVVLIGKRGKDKIAYLTPTNSNEPKWGLPPWKTFGDVVSDLKGPHHSVSFPEKRLRYFRMLGEGQYWKNLPKEIQAEAMGKAYKLGGGKTGFYRRIWFNRPCPTLVTSPIMPATDLCHPTEDRPLSVEEYKRVQGFPDDWLIRGDLSDVYRQIGNAVPIALGKAIGKTIIDDINGDKAKVIEGFPYSRYKSTNDVTWSVG